MLDGRQLPAHLFTALQDRQVLLNIHRLHRQRAGASQGGIKVVEHRVDIRMTTCTHTPKLAMPTDKNAPQIATDAHSCK
ncbi:hypothetical protein GCM10023161_40730 [Mycobacterium paraffinicum]|uniref:Uncharacterized protein n=1 Tax=Mycobacterium paraffinicum TaxID=53378 RepID=A0ABP8F2K2_9MYCO